MSDLISRQQAIYVIHNWLKTVFGVNSTDDSIGVFRELMELPSAEPERKTGKWIKTQYPFEQCSICGAYFDTSNNEANYCCVCGAKMEEEE